MDDNKHSSEFQPPWYLRSAHLQTIIPSVFRPLPDLPLTRKRLELDDGDFIDLDFTTSNLDKPVVLVLHGLEGNSKSHYAAGILDCLQHNNLHGVIMHFRGCTREPNRLPRGYHAGDTGDISVVVEHLKALFPNQPIVAVSYSLGANALLKWLGETGASNPLTAAVAVSVPFELEAAAKRMSKGISRGYYGYLMGKLKRALIRKRDILEDVIDVDLALKSKNFFEFDNRVTAPLHGFDGVDDYYEKSSCRQFLKDITIPTLIIHSEDDPFMTPDVIPAASELGESVTLECSRYGGHVGFISREKDKKFWLEYKIPRWLNQQLAED